jgi:hypothetical protein
LGDVPSPPARALGSQRGLRGHKSAPIGPEGPAHVPQKVQDRRAVFDWPEGLLGRGGSEDRPAAVGVYAGVGGGRSRERAAGGQLSGVRRGSIIAEAEANRMFTAPHDLPPA